MRKDLGMSILANTKMQAVVENEILKRALKDAPTDPTNPQFQEEADRARELQEAEKLFNNFFVSENNGVFTIELNNIEVDDYRISITNILGQEVYNSASLLNIISSQTIDLSDLGRGIYILEVSNSESTISEKIIIE